MAKASYHIKAALDRSYLDHEITLSVGGFQSKAMPMKELLFYALGGLCVLWSATSTFISSASGGAIALFVIWALIAVVYLGGLTKTKELRIQQVPSLLNYFPAASRKVRTRTTSDPSAFYSIAGIDSMEDEGRIHFADGTLGQAYLVVGSASYLLFDDDRNAILNRVDAFWQKVQTNCEFMFITTKEPQRIFHQVAAMERRNQALAIRDPELLELQNEQYDVLVDHVGGKYNSIHQYVLLKARSADALRQADLLLQAEAETSTLMIKSAMRLDRDETVAMLRVLYQGSETDPLRAA